MSNYQIPMKGEEITSRLQSIGTKSDTAAEDTAFGRIAKNTESINALARRYDYVKINGLTTSSTSEQVKAALTPIDGTEVVFPTKGNTITNGTGISIDILAATSNTFSYIHNNQLVTLGFSLAEGREAVTSKVQTSLLKPMYDFAKINALTGESGNDEIEAAIKQLQTSTTTAPSAGALLVDATSLAPLAVVTESSSDAPTMTEVFSYTHGGVKYTVEISGAQGELTAKVTTQAVTQRRYDYSNFSTLGNDGKTSDDIKAALTPIGETEPVWPALNDVLVTNIDNEYKPAACFINVIPLSNDNYVYTISIFYFMTIVASFQIIKEADGTYKIGEKSSIDSFTLSTLQSTVTQQGTQIQQVQQKTDKPLHDLFVSLGAVDNGNGTYTMNEITDLTYNDLTNSYKYYIAGWNRFDLTSAYESANMRTNFKDNINMGGWAPVSIYAMLSGARNIETFSFPNIIYVDSIYSAFNNAKKLKKIIGQIVFPSNRNVLTSETDFYSCSELESIQLKSINKNVWFQDSPKLTKDSILYMIQNSAATSAITITLHPTAYAMAIADTDIQAALEEKTFVSLSQGEPTTE